jgi:hypothetical protein
MTTIAITSLPVATFAATTDVLPIVQSGTTKQVTNALLFTSPTLVTPALGTVASGNISACTSTSMVMVSPVLGTPTSGVLTNCTGTAAGLTAGRVTTNANSTGAVTSVGNATSLGSFTSAQLLAALTDETGTGAAVFATTPTLVTPVIGAATGTSLVLSGLSAVSGAAPTVASAATIAPTTPIVFISGTAAVVTITAPTPISNGGGTITLIPTGAFTWTAAGNIAVLGTAVVSRALTMTYDVTTTKWYPSYV